MPRSASRVIVVVVALLIGAAGGWWWWTRPVSPVEAVDGARVAPVEVPPKTETVSSGEPAYSPLADELHAQRFDAAHDLMVLRGLLGQFTTTLRLAERPPLGDNADIAAALTGGNRRRLVFIPAGHLALRAGVLVDRGGVPYHFHARTADVIDVRSAGPDRVLFTADDLVSP